MKEETVQKLINLSTYIGALSIASITLYFSTKSTKNLTKKKKIEKPKEEHFEDLKTKLDSFFEEKEAKTYLILKNNKTIKKIFEKFDEDKNGIIDKIELHQLLDFIADKLNTKKPTIKEVSEYFEKIDLDHSNEINFEEFEIFLKSFTKKDFEKIEKQINKIELNSIELKKLFIEHDLNQKGYLDKFEISIFFEDLIHIFNLNKKQNELMKFALKNSSRRKKIYFEEFKNFLLFDDEKTNKNENENESIITLEYEIYDQNETIINFTIPFFF